MYALNSPFSPIRALVDEASTCDAAKQFMDGYQDATLKQVIDAFQDFEHFTWLTWFFYHFHALLEPSARFYLLRTLRHEPARLLFFYRVLDDLTPQELDFILDAVQSQLPLAWSQVQLNVITCGTPGGPP